MPVCEDAENGVQSEQKVREDECCGAKMVERYTIFGGLLNKEIAA